MLNSLKVKNDKNEADIFLAQILFVACLFYFILAALAVPIYNKLFSIDLNCQVID